MDDYVIYPHLAPMLKRKELSPVDTHEIMALIAPRPFLYITSLSDGYGGSRGSGEQRALMNFAVARVYELERAPQNFAFYVHSQGHVFEHDGRELAYSWLDKHLKPLSESLPRAIHRPDGSAKPNG